MTTLIILFVAGIANAMMDILKDQWHSSVWKDLPTSNWWYQWAGPDSWRNKWKNDIPVQGERFWLSSTALVFLTYGWHFFQMIWGTAFVFAIVFYQPIAVWWDGFPYWIGDFIILKSVYLVSFNIFYDKIFR